VDDIASKLGLTGSAVRAQMAAMERDGAVRVCRAMESLVEAFVGVPVVECCERAERPRCCFQIGTTIKPEKRRRSQRP
jgi:hypothetical protein